MKIAAIISEYNPFHKGHKYQIDLLRSQGFDIIFSVMSGSFVQRGEPAIYDKFTRAEAALAEGIDFAVELPAPFSMMPAEYFAMAGVIVAKALGATHLSFGSECGDIEKLKQHAEREHFAEAGEGAAYAEFSGTSFSSNDILGIEYIRAIRRYAPEIQPVTHKRIGENYLSEALGEISSATAIRKLIYEGDTHRLPEFVPSGALSVYDGYFVASKLTTDVKLFTAIKSALLFKDSETLSSCFGMGGGLCGRLRKTAERATSLADYYALGATKVYTNARIRRASLFSVLGIFDSVKNSNPEYISLLGAGERGRAYLSSFEPSLPVLTTFKEKSKFVSFEYEKKFDMLYEIIVYRNNSTPIYLSSPRIV